MRRDKHDKLRFASLQGTSAQKLGLDEAENLQSIVFYENGISYNRSTAAIKILMKLGGGWKLMYLFMVLPRFIRDFIYNVVAANRYRWFGKKETCRLPTPEEAAKFLP